METPLVIIPTYNEIENIEAIVQKTLALPSKFDVLVVDDSSPDGTGELVQELQNSLSERLHLLTRTSKEGLGKAYIDGFKWALSKKYDFIFQMDADFSHNPEDLEKLLETLHKNDLVIGSRYCNGVNVVNWPMSRVILSYFASFYVRKVLSLSIMDATAGFVGYKRSLLENLDLENIKFKGYAFQIEMKYKALRQNFKVIEIPIIFTEREKGQSKINNSIILEGVWGVLYLKLKSLIHRKS